MRPLPNQLAEQKKTTAGAKVRSIRRSRSRSRSRDRHVSHGIEKEKHKTDDNTHARTIPIHTPDGDKRNLNNSHKSVTWLNVPIHKHGSVLKPPAVTPSSDSRRKELPNQNPSTECNNSSTSFEMEGEESRGRYIYHLQRCGRWEKIVKKRWRSFSLWK